MKGQKPCLLYDRICTGCGECDRCDLDPRDIEILKRVWVKKQSRVKIAHEMHMSESSLYEHYRNAMLTLRRVILRDHPE